MRSSDFWKPTRNGSSNNRHPRIRDSAQRLHLLRIAFAHPLAGLRGDRSTGVKPCDPYCRNCLIGVRGFTHPALVGRLDSDRGTGIAALGIWGWWSRLYRVSTMAGTDLYFDFADKREAILAALAQAHSLVRLTSRAAPVLRVVDATTASVGVTIRPAPSIAALHASDRLPTS